MVRNSDGFDVASMPLEIKFGSSEETTNNNVSKSDGPKDVSEEWPAEKNQKVFYFVKQRPYEDPEIRSKLDQLEKEQEKLNDARALIFDKLKDKRAEKSELFDLLEPLKSERNGICSSEQELNNMIHSLEYRIQHESNTLNEEKQLIKEIRQLEGTRNKVIANEAVRAQTKESLCHQSMDEVKKERQAISAKIKASKDGIQVLEDELKILNEKKDKTYLNILEFRRQHDEMNVRSYQSRVVFREARDLAARKKAEELEALSHAEVEKFMSLWCSDKNFREDYERRQFPLLDAKQLSRDGRTRNPGEEPLVAPEPMPSETEIMLKEPEEVPVSSSMPDASVPENKAKDTEAKPDSDDDDEVYGLGKPQKEETEEVDEATLKEMRRQEEIAKAKLAMERKKKRAERAAGKAAIRAQMEAEKREMERERKAKKKAGEVVETEEVSVQEKDDEVEDREMVYKGKKQIRSRIQRRGQETPIPRPRMKRKKSSSYGVWAILAALAVLLLLVLGYYYY